MQCLTVPSGSCGWFLVPRPHLRPAQVDPISEHRQRLGLARRQARAAARRIDRHHRPRTRRVLRRHLHEELPSLEAVSASLAMTPQTLRRRLQREGQGFQAIKDSLRRDVAVEYLTQSDLPLLEVAARVGWQGVPAVRDGQLFEIKSADILQPGPAALTDGVEQLHQLVLNWSRLHG